MDLPEAPPAADDEGVAPDDLVFEEHVFSLTFHPTRNLVASGLISGQVFVHEYSADENRQLAAFDFHTGSCRALEFTRDGNFLLTGSQDKSIGVLDCNTGQLAFHITNAHQSPIYAMYQFEFHANELLATGDDEGVIKLWDTRARREVCSLVEHEDYVSSFIKKQDDNMLLSAGGDGYLVVWDLRKNILEARSDNMEDELLSMAIVKHGKKLVVGTTDGILDIFTWGYWGDMSDRFPGHPQSIDACVHIDEDTVATGSSDGLLRLVSILPNKLIGVIGEHRDFPIEKLAMSRDRVLLASCSHDMTVKFWNIQYLYEEGEGDEDAAEAGDEPAVAGISREGGDSDSEGQGDSDDDEDQPHASRKKVKKRAKSEKAEKVNRFFADL